MNTPRVLDAQEKELKRGDRVRRRLLSGHWKRDMYRGVRWTPEVGWVAVTNAMPELPLGAAKERNTYRCPDLLVQKGPTE